MPGFVLTTCMQGLSRDSKRRFCEFPAIFSARLSARLQSTKRRESNCVVVEFNTVETEGVYGDGCVQRTLITLSR